MNSNDAFGEFEGDKECIYGKIAVVEYASSLPGYPGRTSGKLKFP